MGPRRRHDPDRARKDGGRPGQELYLPVDRARAHRGALGVSACGGRPPDAHRIPLRAELPARARHGARGRPGSEAAAVSHRGGAALLQPAGFRRQGRDGPSLPRLGQGRDHRRQRHGPRRFGAPHADVDREAHGASRAEHGRERRRRRGRRPVSAPAQQGGQPRPTLSVFDAVAMIVGLIVGAGIFGTPSIVAGAAGGEAMMIATWIAGGLFAIIGALSYAELSTAFPSAGGEYHFLQRAYGRSLAFLYGWARMTVIVAGSIAVFAYLFGDYMSRVVNLGPYSSPIWAAVVVGVLTIVNYAGIREGKN